MPNNLTVITNPNPHLRVPAQTGDVSYLESKEGKQFIKDLAHTMRKQDGVGLAAIQVALPRRIICIHNTAIPKELVQLLELGRRGDLILVNPEWFPLNAKKQWDGEGCLSVPGLYGEVERHTDIQATALNQRGKKLNFQARDFFARVIQHEVDHLNGILFIDKARKMVNG